MSEIFRPLGDRVLVRPMKPKVREESLLDLGNSQEQEQVLRGDVIAARVNTVWVDSEKEMNIVRTVERADVKGGDVIGYAMYSGKEIKLNGETLLLLTEEEILGVFETQP